MGEPVADHGWVPGRHVRRGIAISEHFETRDTFVFSRTITREDVVGICQLMGLDPWSPDSSTLRPLMQSFATGPAWTPLANLAGFNAIPVSSALEYAAPVEIGDTIAAIAEKEERTREGSLKVRLFFKNHRGELVAEGWALMGAES